MANTTMSREDIGQRGRAMYEQAIRSKVETPENIGKMVIIDVETGDYEVDTTGIESARRLRARHPQGHLFGMRIGYNVAESFGGVMERTAP
jgi:hypothetical protein